MYGKKILFVFVLLLSAYSFAYPQNDLDSTSSNSTGLKHRHSHKFNINFWGNEFFNKPTIALDYGFSKMSQNGLNRSFVNPNLVELKLGYSNEKPSWQSDDILKYRFHYFRLSNITTKLSETSSNSADYNTDLWRFGFGWASGYGYKISKSFQIIPYYNYSIDWSQLKFNSDPANANDKSIIGLYNNSFRFGTSTEGGLKINLIPQIQVSLAYEHSIIFPRHIFWKWAGSVAIETAGQWAVDRFINEIMDSSPYATPIVNFVLKNALSFGVYELRKDKMNWPFDSAAPLFYEQFKVGFTFVL